MTVSPTKTDELTVMPFGTWTQGGPRNNVLDGGPDPHTGTAILTAKRGQPRTCPHILQLTYSLWFSRGQHRYSVNANWGVLDAMHIGATWRIQPNHLCAAAMWPYVKLLW